MTLVDEIQHLVPALDGGLGDASLPHSLISAAGAAVSRTIRALQTCFCDLLRSVATTSKRAWPGALTSITMVVCITPTRTPPTKRES